MLNLKLKIFPVSLLLFAMLIFPLTGFGQSAENVDDVIGDLKDTAEQSGIIVDNKQPPTLYQTIGKFINLFLAFLGVVFLIIIIYAGFVWMMAKGNQEEVNRAIDWMKNAFIGIIIVLAAYLLTNYVVFRILEVAAPPPAPATTPPTQ